MHRRLAEFIRRRFIYQEASSVPIATFDLKQFKDVLRLVRRKISSLEPSMFVVLLDEYENLFPYQQRVVNSLVKLGPPDISIKIAKKLASGDTPGTTTGQELQEIHDYTRVPLVYNLEDPAERKAYHELLRHIVENMVTLEEARPFDMDQLLPRFSDPEVEQPLCLTEVSKLNKMTNEEFNSLPDDKRHEKKTYYGHAAIYRVLLGRPGRHREKRFAGFSDLALLGSGVIRYFQEFLSVGYHLTFGGAPPKGVLVLPPDRQSKAVHVVSQHNLTTLSRNVERYGEELKYFLLDLGDCLRHKLLKHTSEPEAARLTIKDPEMLEDNSMAALKHILAVGEREGVFQTQGRTSSVQAEARLRSATYGVQYLSSLRARSSNQPTAPLENDLEVQATARPASTRQEGFRGTGVEGCSSEFRGRRRAGSVFVRVGEHSMKLPLTTGRLLDGAVLVTCSSHEERCKGLAVRAGSWSPGEVVLFHYDDDNPIREENHRQMETAFQKMGGRLTVLEFTEGDAVTSLRENMQSLRRAVDRSGVGAVVMDISVFTKRHLLMMLKWLDDRNLWDRLYIVYSEPGDYLASEYVPLSFGLASLQQAPGFSACPDLSRPVHLMVFLGYEGDRALAVHELIQPMKTTLAVPDPSYKPEWAGRTERFNHDLLTLVGERHVRRVDALDPDATNATLADVLGRSGRDDFARIICPLGTKPQTLGIYNYVRTTADPPAIVYAGPLRHNHAFYSTGLGETWILKTAGDK